MKTKLGISCGLLAAAVYFCALFGWTTAAVLIAGYILIAEQDRLLKIAAVKAVAVSLAFSLLSLFVGFIPDAINLIDRTLGIFGGNFSLSIVTRIVGWINLVLNICEKVVLLILAFAAFKQRTVTIPVIDKLIVAHFPFEGAPFAAAAPVPAAQPAPAQPAPVQAAKPAPAAPVQPAPAAPAAPVQPAPAAPAAPVQPAPAAPAAPVQPAPAAPQPAPQPAAGNKFCPHCGKQLKATAGFCSNCGNKV